MLVTWIDTSLNNHHCLFQNEEDAKNFAEILAIDFDRIKLYELVEVCL